MSTPKAKPSLRSTSIDFIEIECPRPIVPCLVIRLTQGITILIESTAVNLRTAALKIFLSPQSLHH